MGKHKRSWSSGATRVNRSIRVDDAPCGSIIRVELCYTVRLPNGTGWDVDGHPPSDGEGWDWNTNDGGICRLVVTGLDTDTAMMVLGKSNSQVQAWIETLPRG